MILDCKSQYRLECMFTNIMIVEAVNIKILEELIF